MTFIGFAQPTTVHKCRVPRAWGRRMWLLWQCGDCKRIWRLEIMTRPMHAPEKKWFEYNGDPEQHVLRMAMPTVGPAGGSGAGQQIVDSPKPFVLQRKPMDVGIPKAPPTK